MQIYSLKKQVMCYVFIASKEISRIWQKDPKNKKQSLSICVHEKSRIGSTNPQQKKSLVTTLLKTLTYRIPASTLSVNFFKVLS